MTETLETPVDEERIYPCDDCGKLRTKAEGGTVFTVCDECWEKHWNKGRRKIKILRPFTSE
jgi:hypothetical protein